MATGFPNSLDALTNPNSTDSLSNPSHAQQHTNLNDAVEAIETKIGIDGSNDSNSIQYKVAAIQTTLTNIENSTSVAELLLGLEGNNDLTISGIENKTTVDSFAKSLYSTIRYTLQIKKDNLFVSDQLDIVNDGTDLHMNRYEISSNTNTSLYTVQLEENAGIISLKVTPTSGSITARYYRTALKF
jgi:hypothetical protein